MAFLNDHSLVFRNSWIGPPYKIVCGANIGGVVFLGLFTLHFSTKNDFGPKLYFNHHSLTLAGKEKYTFLIIF